MPRAGSCCSRSGLQPRDKAGIAERADADRQGGAPQKARSLQVKAALLHFMLARVARRTPAGRRSSCSMPSRPTAALAGGDAQPRGRRSPRRAPGRLLLFPRFRGRAARPARPHRRDARVLRTSNRFSFSQHAGSASISIAFLICDEAGRPPPLRAEQREFSIGQTGDGDRRAHLARQLSAGRSSARSRRCIGRGPQQIVRGSAR